MDYQAYFRPLDGLYRKLYVGCMPANTVREKARQAMEGAEHLTDQAKRLRQRFRRIENGDTVRIVWILDSPDFDCRYAREKMEGWIAGRNKIVEYGKKAARTPSYPPRKTRKKNKWRPEKFSLRGKVLGKIGKDLWKIEVSIETEDCVGAFCGKEMIFIERAPCIY